MARTYRHPEHDRINPDSPREHDSGDLQCSNPRCAAVWAYRGAAHDGPFVPRYCVWCGSPYSPATRGQ